MLVATACGGGEGGEGAGPDPLDDPRWDSVVVGAQERQGEPVQGGSIVVGLESETSTYLPSQFQGNQAAANVAYAIYDPLMTRDADGNVRPYLAESIEPNDEFSRWRLRLRPGVRFHDGTVLDAVALERIFEEHLLAEGALSAAATRYIDDVQVVDELAVDYVLTAPYAQFPELLQLQLGWPFSPDAADRLGNDFGSQPVGTGPFRFVSWQRDGDLVVERNPDYWQPGLPYLDRITFRALPDEATRAASLASGDVDAIQGVSLSDLVATVADTPGVEVVLGRGNGGSGMLFNTTAPPIDDLRIRQALAHAVDQEALVELVAGEAAALSEPRTQHFPSDSPFYSEEVADAWLGYDPERAEELYQEYVDDPNRSDGRPPGEPVSLTIDATNVPSVVELATAYEGFYETVGFEVTVEPLEQALHVTRALTDDYQLKLFRMGTNSSPLGEFVIYDDPAEIPANFSNFHDDVVADGLDRLRRTDDTAEQAEVAEELGIHLAEQVPWQWTGSDLAFIAANERVEGLRSWQFPDGTLGDGVLPAVGYWGQVWVDS